MKKYSFIAYCLGLASGYAIGYFTLKKRFDERMDAEVESVKESLRSLRKEKHKDTNVHFAEKDPLKNAREEAVKIAKEKRYVSYNNLNDEKEATIEERAEMKPKVINPDDIDMSGQYPVISLTYYADGVVTDENDEEFKDAESYIGDDALKSFGRYDDNSVYVWNGRLRVYYEILKDERTYAEVLEKYPYLKEDE